MFLTVFFLLQKVLKEKINGKTDKLNDLRYAEERAIDLLESNYKIDLSKRQLLKILDNCAGQSQREYTFI